MFTKRVHKLKQCTNLRLLDENYIHPLLSHYSSTKWGEGGAYFKFRPIGGALIRGGRGGGANSKIYGISDAVKIKVQCITTYSFKRTKV